MKRSLKRTLAIGLSMLIGATGGAALQAPANAALADCPQGYVCAWANAYYGGQRWQWFPWSGCLNLTGSNANNVFSSATNKNGAPDIYGVDFYDGSSCGSSVPRQTIVGTGNISVFNTSMNNKTSSINIIEQ